MATKSEIKHGINMVWKSYHTPSMPNYAKRTKNAVFISPSNSLEHEQAKLELCYLLRKDKKDFITEAVPNSDHSLRHDVVCLNDGVVYEIETTLKRSLRFKGVSGVRVIKMWKGCVSVEEQYKNP